MDLGKITGKTLDLPQTTVVFVVDFAKKKVLLTENIENSTFDRLQWERIEAAVQSLEKDASKAKKGPKKTPKSA